MSCNCCMLSCPQTKASPCPVVCVSCCPSPAFKQTCEPPRCPQRRCPVPCQPCRKVSKAKKGEPTCGCVYGCPCKAACYDWNPCIKPIN